MSNQSMHNENILEELDKLQQAICDRHTSQKYNVQDTKKTTAISKISIALPSMDP